MDFNMLLGLGTGISPAMQDDDFISRLLGEQRQPPSPIEALLRGGSMSPKNLPPGTISETGAMPGRIMTEAMAPNAPWLNIDGNKGPRQPSYNDAPANSDEAVEVVGDGWKPKKRSTLGTILDVLFAVGGGEPVFAQRIRQQNLNRAMEGFTQDPVQAIRRLSQIKGMEGKAWEMFNQHQDNTRADSVAQRQFGTAADKARVSLGGYLAAIGRSKNPAEAYKKMLPTLRQMAEARGVEGFDLPEEYDEDAIDFWTQGSISPEDQYKMAAIDQYRRGRLAQGDRRLDQQEQNTESLIDNRQNTMENRDRRTAIAQQNANRPRGGKGAGGGIYLEDPRTGERVGVLNKERTMAKITRGDKYEYWSVDGTGKPMKKIKEVPINPPQK